MWQIIPQEVKNGYVNVKKVEVYPIKDRKTKEIKRFGRLINSCHRLLFKHHLNLDHEQWMITLGKYGYNITCPKRIVLKDRWTRETEVVPGRAFGGNSSSGSMGDQALRIFLVEMCGADFAEEVLSAFKKDEND